MGEEFFEFTLAVHEGKYNVSYSIMAVIYCFGDSITYGAWDIQKSGWSARLRDYVDDIQLKDPDKYFLCYNLGIPGETTEGLVKRFEIEFNARSKEEEGEESIFIFAFGANDSVYMPEAGRFKVSKEQFVDNLGGILDMASKHSKKIVLVNITPADEVICAERYAGKDKVRLNKNVIEYNQALAELAKKKGLPLVDVYSVYEAAGPQTLLSEDGLHPNEAGHQAIFDKVKEVIDPLL
jgi:lysophospholipase L1-like esterase